MGEDEKRRKLMPTETEQRILDAIEGVQVDVNSLKGDVHSLQGDVNLLKGDVNSLKGEMNAMQLEVKNQGERLGHLEKTVDKLDKDGDRFNDRFLNYQSSIDKLVNLSTSLIASATIAVIVSIIFKR